MTGGILIVLALALVCGRIGLAIGNWWVHSSTSGELESAFPPFIGAVLGAAAGLGIGLGIAYLLGRREQR
ncbi:MAG TPA: hypothetical protein VEV43_06900 [Actinomycetota bacterium]|nr:hypothetical protein [Actinomycetota bacterium]